MASFRLESSFRLIADQQHATDQLAVGILRGDKAQVLLGVTGSGKTFTLANVIARLNRPTLVISHNKTLAAQLYGEFRGFFPSNAVEYFVSYYDYYQPEAYIPQTDVYIEKDASINDRLDRLRLSATTSLMSRRDTVVVSSVSCIYSLGSPEEYQNSMVFFKRGTPVGRDVVLRQLLDIQYERNDFDLARGKVRVRGDVIEIFPAYRQEALRIEFFGDEIEHIRMIEPVSGEIMAELDQAAVYPAKHFVVSAPRIEEALTGIRQELEARVKELEGLGKLVEAQRLRSRTGFDLEMLKEAGYCNGIENYSRVLSGRSPGARPHCLIDYFPKDLLVIIDESHVTIPQIRGMYAGDRSRKEMLVAHGFRLPSCLDNRPLKFDEFLPLIGQVIYVSATPDEFETGLAAGRIIEQVNRPTGIPDPQISLRPAAGQVEDLLGEVRARAARNERVLVTTLTKRMSEDLSEYLSERGIKVKYLHSDIETIERTRILQDLRARKYDCLVGVNLLREGLDLPEVSLVAILDADKQGFLRSQTSLMQTAGRAARHKDGVVIMYADTVSQAMHVTIAECDRRRKAQLAFNAEHGITPKSVIKAIQSGIEAWSDAEGLVREVAGQDKEQYEFSKMIDGLERQMELCARNLEFEKAARMRDRIMELKSVGGDHSGINRHKPASRKEGRGVMGKGIICILLALLSGFYGCAMLEAAGEAVGVVGKAGWAAVKAVGGAAYAGTSMAGQTANQTNKTLSRTSSRRDTGISVTGDRAVVPLEREDKSYYVRLKINGKVSGRFLLDTGASAVQISRSMAKKLKVDRKKSQAIPVTLAGGAMVAGRMVTLDEISLGGMSAHHVKAIILDYERKQSSDGLLGMSFLENFIFQIDTQKNELILTRR